MEGIAYDGRYDLDPIESGLELLQSGLESLTKNSNPRGRKHAILDLASGVGLLLRERLRQEHWSLVFADPGRASKAQFEEGRFVPVGLTGSLDRLESVCGVEVPARWRWGIEALDKRRGQLEARGVVESTPALASIALSVVSPFVDSVPPGRLTQPLVELLERIKSRLGILEEYVASALKRIKSQRPDEALLTCPNCRQESALAVIDGPGCLFCGYTGKPEVVADEYARDLFPDEDRPLYRCPACRRDTLLDVGAPDEDPWYKCFACGEWWSMDDLVFCVSCGQPFEPPEDDPEEEYCPACRGEGGE